MSLITRDDHLPLICTRHGTCCFGAVIRITPWELAVLTNGIGMAPDQFRDRHTCDGGTALRLDGEYDAVPVEFADLCYGGEDNQRDLPIAWL